MRTRWAMAAIAAVVLLSLTGCVPAQLRATAIEESVRDLPGVTDLRVSSNESGINKTASVTAHVEMAEESTVEQITDVVEAWYGQSDGTGIRHSLTIELGDYNHAIYFDRAGILLDRLTDYAEQWRTLVPHAEVVVASVREDESSTRVEWPAAASPAAVRPAVDNIRAIIAGVEAPGTWMITSNDEVGADQVFAVISDGLPDEQELAYLETLDAAFIGAEQLGEVALTVTYGDIPASVDVDLLPDEFRSTPGNQIADQLLDSDVWPVLQQFTAEALQGSVSRLTLSVFGSPMAVVDAESCERPDKERFPLDFEVWDYWASINASCSP